mmetsp:Transcript_18260/g.59547  ORF Transcript_18260/g.59547 Transcript_18260/m.59547 type:complete len:335 (-) Transcript_18260:70-1074(-)
MAVEVVMSKASRVYTEGQNLEGYVVVTAPSGGLHHNGISLQAVGSAVLKPSEKAVGVFESFFVSKSSINLLQESIILAPAGKCPEGQTTYPFSFPLRASSSDAPGLVETYHGKGIYIQYGCFAEIQRKVFSGGPLSSGTLEFVLEVKPQQQPPSEGEGGEGAAAPPPSDAPVEFILDRLDEGFATAPGTSAELVQNGFRIRGCLNRDRVPIAEPLSGYVVIDSCSCPIRSIDLRLSSDEMISLGESSSKNVVVDRHDIQFTQVADGDVARNVELPIHLVIPRLTTCPSITQRQFSIHFYISVVATFLSNGNGNDPIASIKVPVTLVRGQPLFAR